MNFKVTFDREDGFFIVYASGCMTADGYTAMAKTILNHPDWVPGRHGIFDHRELDFSATTLKDLEQIREFHRSHEKDIGDGKTAIVVKPGYTMEWEAMWLQGEKIKSTNVVRVFDSYPDAAIWLCV